MVPMKTTERKSMSFRDVIKYWSNHPLRWAHHPTCAHFKNHWIVLRNQKICRGCLFFYPSLAVGFLIGLLQASVIQNLLMQAERRTYVAFSLITILFLLGILSIAIPKRTRMAMLIKDVLRLFQGLTVSIMMLVAFLFEDLLLTVVLLAALIFFARSTMFFRKKSHRQICKSCPQFSLRDSLDCDGLKTLKQYRLHWNALLSKKT